MATSKGKILAISVFAAAALSVCGVSAAEFEPVQPGDELIFFSAPEFSKIKSTHNKREDADTREEHAVFIGAGMHAVIGFVEAINDEIVFNFDLSVKNVVDMFNYNNKQKKEWGSADSVDSSFGKFIVKSYRLPEKNQECFGFSVEADYSTWDDYSRPTKLLFGYYCEREGDPLPPSKIISLIKSITVK